MGSVMNRDAGYTQMALQNRVTAQVVVRPEVLPLTGASLSPLNIEDAGARERFCWT